MNSKLLCCVDAMAALPGGVQGVIPIELFIPPIFFFSRPIVVSEYS